MAEKHDIIMIGMGPAGMAVSAMASSMGLDVLSIEKNKIGGECLNIGCIPSKALLKAGEVNYIAKNLKKYGIKSTVETIADKPLEVVREKIGQINNKKFKKTFEKVKLIKSEASFVDKKTVIADGKEYTAKKIFIGTGTEPFIPPIPGLKDVNKLTNVNMFEQESVPKRLMVIGGGAIGTEMAQAFKRLGSEVILAQMDAHLIPGGDADAGEVLKNQFEEEGIKVYNSTNIEKVSEKDGVIYTETDKGTFESDEILVATGRKPVLKPLKLENARIKYDKTGIKTNEKLQTNHRHIYAVGDCNGRALLSHAAMHQGMIALMNAMNPMPFFKKKVNDYIVPWSVFTKPEVAQAGVTEKVAREKGMKYEVIRKEYKDYGRTVADGKPEGFIKVILSPLGKIYGVSIVGEGASEMIHEWILAIQKNMRITDILMMQHSFPTLSMINKMIAEDWMMEQTKKYGFISKIAKFLI
ncbi:MAG: dihydrolipoyl dehydrogenase family protein [Fusobacteriota bacterium]